AHHHLRVAEKIWMMVTEKFFNSTPHIAKKILDHLVSPSPFREEHPVAESSSPDPWNQLTQSMRSLSENVERLNVATEKCIRVIDDSLPSLPSLHSVEDREPHTPEEKPPEASAVSHLGADVQEG